MVESPGTKPDWRGVSNLLSRKIEGKLRRGMG